MSENKDKDRTNEEIDLLDIFNRMGKALSRWGRALARICIITIIFLLKRWLPLTISLVAGVAISFYLKTGSESFYISDMVVRNNSVSNSDMISYINKLHGYCKERNKVALADALSDKPESVKNIVDISAYWIIDKGKDGIPDQVDYFNSHNVYDTLNVRMQDRFDIRVRIKTPQELLKLKNSIFAFVKKDSLFQQKNRVRLRQNRELLGRLDYDILELDSLQKVKYFEETRSRKPQNGGQMIFLQEQKTQLVYPDIYTLYSRKQNLELERDLYPEILTVLIDFNLPAKPKNTTLFYGKFIIPALFIITLVLLIFLANRKKLKELFNRY
jgi:hypothetical protein